MVLPDKFVQHTCDKHLSVTNKTVDFGQDYVSQSCTHLRLSTDVKECLSSGSPSLTHVVGLYTPPF